MSPRGRTGDVRTERGSARTVCLKVSTNEDSEDDMIQDTVDKHPQPGTVCQFLKKHKWTIIIIVIFLVSVFATFFIGRGSIHCGQKLPEWVWHNNIGYYYSNEKLDWSSSKKFCENEGAMLAVLKDGAIEKNVMRFKADGDDHWYGYYQMDGEWKWLDKSSLENERLNNISGLNCKTWNPSNQWKTDCSSKRKFICVSVQ